MLKIIIYSKNATQRKQWKQFIKNYVLMENLDAQVILATSNTEKIVAYSIQNFEPILYFLDIDCRKTLDLALTIRQKNIKSAIVFLASHTDIMPMIFENNIQALDYILKTDFDVLRERIAKCISLTQERLLLTNHEKKRFIFKSDGKIISEDYNDILFFEKEEKQSQKVIIHTKNRKLDFYGTLGKIEKTSQHFFRCHRSVLVNKKLIKTINPSENEITMIDGSVCYASLQGMKKLIQSLNTVN